MTSNNETVYQQMPGAGNIAKTTTSNGKQFTIICEMLTAVAEHAVDTSITNHLMTGPLGNSEFCFPRISTFPSTLSQETLRFSGNKIHCSPRGQSLSANYHTIASCSLIILNELLQPHFSSIILKLIHVNYLSLYKIWEKLTVLA